MDDGNPSLPAGTNRIALNGEYDLTRKEELAALFSELSSNTGAVVDLSQVTYVDSTFLHVLASLYFRLKPHGVTLTGANTSIRRLLSIVKFDGLFHIADPL